MWRSLLTNSQRFQEFQTNKMSLLYKKVFSIHLNTWKQNRKDDFDLFLNQIGTLGYTVHWNTNFLYNILKESSIEPISANQYVALPS